MEPVTFILSTLGAGAAAAAKETTAQAVKDTYAGLKELIKQRFAGKPVAQTALAQYEEDPETWEAPLKKELEKTAAAQDQDVLAAAARLEQLLATSGVSVVASGVRSVAVGRAVSGSTIITGDQNTVRAGEPSLDDQ